jgi:hypothetical protein
VTGYQELGTPEEGLADERSVRETECSVRWRHSLEQCPRPLTTTNGLQMRATPGAIGSDPRLVLEHGVIALFRRVSGGCRRSRRR